MPTIDVAMAQSLYRTAFEARDLASTASEVKTSFSSWDNCMAQSYCKWPVIAAIIIGGLIVFSVVWCIIRCACCGLSCCCGCFSCLKCCGDCCGCCDARDKRHKHLDEPYSFPPPFAPHSGYQQPGAMMSGGAGTPSPFDPPKFASFETGPNGMAVAPKTPVSDDALPPMPSWDTAAKRKVSLDNAPDAAHTPAVELGDLDPATGQRVPLMAGGLGALSRTGSPASPYGHQQQPPGGYMSPGPGRQQQQQQMMDPYARQGSVNSQRGPAQFPDAYPQARGQTGSPLGAGRGYGAPPPPPLVEAPYNPSFPAELYGGSQSGGGYHDGNGGAGYGGAPTQQQQQQQRVGGYGGGEEAYGGGGYGGGQTLMQQAQRMGSPVAPQPMGGMGGSGGFAPQLQQQPQRMGSPGFAAPQPQRQFTGGSVGGMNGTAPPSYASRSPGMGQGQMGQGQGGYRGGY